MTTALDVGELYRDIVMDHHCHPRGRDAIARVDATAEGRNTSCGDEVHLDLQLEDTCVHDLCVTCQGCAISTASASMLAEVLRGKNMTQVRQISAGFNALMKRESRPDGLDLQDLEALQGVRDFPVRVKCALLPWTTLEQALQTIGSVPSQKVET